MRSRQPWTKAQLQRLAKDYPDTLAADIAARLGRSLRSVYAKARALGLAKSAEFLERHGGRLQSGEVGEKTRFQPGGEPWNKGMKGWSSGGRSVDTRFAPGTLNGRARELYQPIGTERLHKGGYRQRKVNDDLPMQRRWRMVHHLVWEKEHGPIPPGHVVTFTNGDPNDCRLENLALISRRELARRNSIHRYPQELADVMRLKARVTRKINKIGKP